MDRTLSASNLSETVVREALADRLDAPLADEEWDALWEADTPLGQFKERWTRDIADLAVSDPEDFDKESHALLGEMRAVVAFSTASRRTVWPTAARGDDAGLQGGASDQLDALTFARSVELAMSANRSDAAVAAYRRDHLPASAVFLRSELDQIATWARSVGGHPDGGGRQITWYALDHESQRLRTVQTMSNGSDELDRLADLAQRLVARYGWLDETSATSFVLWAYTPWAPLVSARPRTDFHHPWLDRVVIEASPLVPGHEVQRRYVEVQRKMLASRGSKRSKLPSIRSSQAWASAAMTIGWRAGLNHFIENRRARGETEAGFQGAADPVDTFRRTVVRLRAQVLPMTPEAVLERDGQRRRLFRERVENRRARGGAE